MLNLWSIYPGAEVDVLGKLHDYRAWLVTGGPAQDAEREGLPVRVYNGSAVVPLVGPMMRRLSFFAAWLGMTSTDMVRAAVASALADDDIDQVVMVIDSPGGEVAGLAELADLMYAADKPIVAVVEGMAASAAYYVASQADRILVGRNDLVGSIGTRIMLYDYSKMYAEAGVEAVPIDTGRFKSAGAIGTEITEEQRADFQRIVDFYFGDFVNAVARGRNLSTDDVRQVGDGRMFTPVEALAAGLIDGVGGIADVLTAEPPRRSTQSARARLRV